MATPTPDIDIVAEARAIKAKSDANKAKRQAKDSAVLMVGNFYYLKYRT